MTTSNPTTSAVSPWGARTVLLALSLILAAVLALTLRAGTAHAAPFNVVNTNDSGPGSLRTAILRANANANPSDQDNINFNIPADTDPGCDAASGVCTISPQPDLPDITEPVIVDGYTQAGASPNTLSTGSDAALKVELSGEVAGGGANGLRILASNCVVRGLVINRWSNEGVEINGTGGPGVSGNRVEGNFIGTDATGEEAFGNVNGVRLVDDASDNVVGGTSAAARNVVSGNFRGFEVIIGSNGNKIQGNYVGTDASGTQDLGNESEGVEILTSTDNVVGGTSAAARNVISGNDDGVALGGIEVGGNDIRGNYIGTDASGTQDLGNADDGVELVGESLANVVGGTSAGARNIISGNDDDGVVLNGGANGTAIRGNYIGTDASGQGDLGNGDEGVVVNDATNTAVGGNSASAANTLAFNAGDGVDVNGPSDGSSGDPGTGNSILRNSVFDNGELGIDLDGGDEDPNDVTPNDPQDPDPGPNLLQNFPTITSAETPDGSSASIQGTLNSNPNESFTLRFFSSPEADPSGYGEGKTFLGQTNVTANAGGNAAFTFSTDISVAAGESIAATATNVATGDTSEFSEAVEVVDERGPRVVSTRPEDAARGVPARANAFAFFSEPMRASTINANTFKLFLREGGTQTFVPSSVSYDAALKRASLNPNADLEPGGSYVATVTTGARDLAGNPLVERKNFRFTVAR